MRRLNVASSLLSAAGICLMAALGCSEPGPRLPPTVPVQAQVTIDGKSLSKALIAFSPVDPGPSSNGRVEDGKVVDLWTNGQKEGVVVGNHKVTIYDDDIESGSVDLVPNRYGRIDKGFDITVSEEGPNEFKFELKRK